MNNTICQKLYILFNPKLRFIGLNSKGFFRFLDDETCIKKLFKVKMGYQLDLDNPKTFNEKLQWLKLHDRNPIYTSMVDKYAVKEYVASVIGDQYIIPTLGVWDRFEDIDFDSLPNQFVLKCTHDSGGLIIVKDKSKMDLKAARNKINKSLKRNYYYVGREWPYKNVKPRILAEQYIVDPIGKELCDYKIHSFNGEPKMILVCQDRYSPGGLTEDFFDVNWTHLEVKRPKHGNAITNISKPNELDEMLEIARKLSMNIPFIRVDLFNANGSIYFGELTFYPAGGFEHFVPDNFDMKLGSQLQLYT